MGSKIEPDRYADKGFAVADTSANLNGHLFGQMMRKTGAERLAIGCQMADTARQLVWAGIPGRTAGVRATRPLSRALRWFYACPLVRRGSPVPQGRRQVATGFTPWIEPQHFPSPTGAQVSLITDRRSPNRHPTLHPSRLPTYPIHPARSCPAQ